MTNKAKTEDKAAKAAPESKPVTAPENKDQAGNSDSGKTDADEGKAAEQGDAQDQAERVAEMISGVSDDELRKMVTDGGKAMEIAQAEMQKRGLTDEAQNERGLTAADIAATDHSDTQEMTFLKDGAYDLAGGARIVGRKGDRCALKPDDVKQAVASGLMAIVEPEPEGEAAE